MINHTVRRKDGRLFTILCFSQATVLYSVCRYVPVYLHTLIGTADNLHIRVQRVRPKCPKARRSAVGGRRQRRLGPFALLVIGWWSLSENKRAGCGSSEYKPHFPLLFLCARTLRLPRSRRPYSVLLIYALHNHKYLLFLAYTLHFPSHKQLYLLFLVNAIRLPIS